MKKITAKKDESLAEIIDRVLDEVDQSVVVSVPKGSPLSKSARNFHILKNEVEAAGKRVFVESSDPGVAALAAEAGISAEPPQEPQRSFTASGAGRGPASPDGARGGIADIVLRPEKDATSPIQRPAVPSALNASAGTETDPAVKKPIRRKVVQLNVGASDAIVGAEKPITPPPPQVKDEAENIIAEETEQEKKSFFSTAERFFKPRSMEEIGPLAPETPARRGKRLWIVIGVLVAIVVGVYAFTAIFGRADITINFKKTPWQYQGNYTADKSISPDKPIAQNAIAGTVFSTNKNATQLFPASANQDVSIRAQGTLTIYNAYSSAAQQLVATTRFVTPDGKIFRLVNGVTVPGAAVTNGQIVPSSITTPVVADKAGPDYNVGQISKLAVPGFQGTAKYNGFYGALASGTAGGFTGKKAVPTAADIASAKSKMTAILQSSLQTGIAAAYPGNFKIPDGATSVTITKLTVNSSTDQNGNFTVFGEATLQAIGFDETAFKQYLLSLAQATLPSSTWSGDPTLNYSNVKPDFTNGRLGFSVAVQGSLEPAFSVDDFKNSITGKSVNDARTAIAGLPQLQDGSISVWPAWVWSIPGNPDKIAVTVN